MIKPEFGIVGKSIPRVDAVDKATGRAKYAADITPPGALYGKILRSPHAHALIKRIDVSRAAALNGVAAIITHENTPDVPYTSCGHPFPYDTPEDMHIFSTHLRYVGDPVAAVAADTPQIALDALNLIDVEYEVLPFYLTPEEAKTPGALEIHAGTGNILGESSYEIGDVEAGFAAADIVLTEEFDTPIVTHTPIEPHVSLAEVDFGGKLTIYTASQCPHIIRERLAHIFGLQLNRVRVIKTTIGGGFGGKQEPIYEPINAALAFAAKKPVLLELTREECIASTRTRHASHIVVKSGVMRDGTLVAQEMRITNNTGAYSSHGHNVIHAISTKFKTLYRTPNLRFIGKSVYTNILIAGAMRAYGSPQYSFAMESHMDDLARRIGMDPLAFRIKNLYTQEDSFRVEGLRLDKKTSFGLPECISTVCREIGYDEYRNLPHADGKVRRGIGVAISAYAQSCYSHSVELSCARIMVNEDATISLFVGCTEIGQGCATVMAQIAAEAFGVPFSWVNVIDVDTDISPFDPGAYASRQTYVAGNAVKKAALACKEDLLQYAARKLALDYSRLNTCEGYIVDRYNDMRYASMADVAWQATYSFPQAQVFSHEASYYPTDNMYTYGVTAAEVAVDISTGQVHLKKLYTAMDCGKLINPKLAMGQLNGANIMSMGFGLSEQILINPKTGRVYNDNLLDYKIPTFADVPELEGYFIETDEPSSAYGNKALGEPPMIAVGAAIRNAVVNATGVEINRGPLTPERVFLALKAAGKREV